MTVTACIGSLIAAGSGAAGAAPLPSRTPAAAPAAPRVVLIVHLDHAQRPRTAAARARGAHVALRHVFTRQGSYSVSVPSVAVPAALARLSVQPGVIGVEKAVPRTFFGTPDDPQLPRQRQYLDAVAAPAAWSVQPGSPSVKIAVVDSGVDVGHPDLATKIVGTYNAHDGGTVVTDSVGHGTFVSGVAAAATNNGIGIAGAGYNSSLLAVKVADAGGEVSIDDEAAGIRWAADHGADIINLSLGGPDPSSTEGSAVAYAQSKGVLVVAAAGNAGDATKEYPAAYPGVVAVGATDTATGRRAAFSTYGAWVTLAAPGVAIRSTAPRAGSDFFPTSSGYDVADGTSFSSPIVAGEAALLEAQRPGLDLRQLRRALTASAHGYGRQGLGAGQVDFAAGLRHLPPATIPSAVSSATSSDLVVLQATSTAAAVRLRVDSGALLALTPTSDGQAQQHWASWGFPNGTHRVRAYDCTAYDECSRTARSSTFTLANTAAILDTPRPGQQVSGLMTLRASHPGGGALRLVIDRHGHGIDTRAPYTFNYSASLLADGTHTARVRLCSLDGTRCDSPGSPPATFTSRSLHPQVAALSPVHISPNRDRTQDSSVLDFVLPQAQRVSVSTVDARGITVRTDRLGTLAAGSHRWVWRGTGSSGPLPDGAYRLVLRSSRVYGSTTVRGWVARSGVVDTHGPRLSGATGNGVRFYPYPDTYRDRFRPRITTAEAGRMTLTIRDRSGRLVRNLSEVRRAGRTGLDWAGAGPRGSRVPAGTYRWTFSMRDAAGNRTQARRMGVVVSAARLTPLVSSVTLPGTRHVDAAGTTPACSSAARDGVAPAHGVHLVNRCPDLGYELAYARFRFTLPAAYSYQRLVLQTYGRSVHRPSELTSFTVRPDGNLEVSGYVKITASGTHWRTLANMSAADHISSRRRVESMVMLTSTYRGGNDYDVQYVRLRVSYTALR